MLLWLAMIFAGLFLAYSVRVGVSIAWFRNPTRQELINAGIIGGNSSSGSNVSLSRVDPDLKKFLDSYEDFVDEYCKFMKSYDVSDFSALTEYLSLLQKEEEMTKDFDKLQERDMNQAELDYYNDVSLRCAKKLLDAAAGMN